VRSPALAVLGIALLAGAAVLGGLLVHDGEVAVPADLSRAAPGASVELKGEPQPFAVARQAPGPWRSVLPLLGNHTSMLTDGDNGVVALLTGPQAPPPGTVLADGTVRYVGPHPDGSGRLLVVVAVHAWRQPILFR